MIRTTSLLVTFFVATAIVAEPAQNVVRIGGYGELHLNARFPASGVRPPAEFDFHRFVLMFDYSFSDAWSFTSELELEHNFVEGNKKSGYLILEQAYLKWQFDTHTAARAGILLQPMGLINENHEPTHFSSVERPEYHRIILPSTWFGAGIALEGDVVDNTLRYDLMLTEGLDDRKFGRSQGIREARQKGFYSKLDNLLGTFRLAWTGVPGLRTGGSIAVNQMVSDRDTLPLIGGSASLTGPNPNRHLYHRAVIGEMHASWNGNGFRSSIEFASIAYSPIAGRGGTLKATRGLLVETGYDVARFRDAAELKLYPFVRYSRLNTGGGLGDDGAYHRIDAGFALLPISQVVVKVDLGREFQADAGRTMTYLNAGFGYDF